MLLDMDASICYFSGLGDVALWFRCRIKYRQKFETIKLE